MHKALLTKEDTETFQDNIKQHYHFTNAGTYDIGMTADSHKK